MTKKDYQAIAAALYQTQPFKDFEPGTVLMEWHESVLDQWRTDRDAIATVLAEDSPRFGRATFIAACEDGNVGRRPKRTLTVTELIHGSGHVSASDDGGEPAGMMEDEG